MIFWRGCCAQTSPATLFPNIRAVRARTYLYREEFVGSGISGQVAFVIAYVVNVVHQYPAHTSTPRTLQPPHLHRPLACDYSTTNDACPNQRSTNHPGHRGNPNVQKA